jgi:hypothetical protein
MESVSSKFKELIYASSREITTKVTFEMIDESALKNATVGASSQASISRLGQVINKKRSMTHSYATFEPNYFKLDGSMKIPPETYEEGSNDELGFWSALICDGNGIFSSDPQITLTLGEPHNTLGLTINFDPVNNEYPSEFTIGIVAFENDALLLNQTFVGHDSPTFTLSENLDGVKSVTIIIRKWAKGNRRARIVEIDFGLIQEYTGSDLINFDVIEEMDLIGSTVPSNELHFTLDNQERLFNILNPNGIYRFILPRQEIRAYMGLRIGEGENDFEFVSLGKYYLTEWQTDEGALTTSFTARDIFDQLGTMQYANSLTDTNLYALAENIFLQAEITDYQIDDKLVGESTKGYTEPVNAREALQDIAIAGRAVIYQNRQGKVIIKRMEALTIGTGYITYPGPDIYAGLLAVPEVTNDYGFQAIDFENTFAEPQVKLNEAISSLVFLVKDGTTNGTEYTFTNPTVIKGGVSFKIENPLINSAVDAEQVANWMFEEYNVRGYYTANWRQNPSLACGDAIMVENSFGDEKKARIVKQNFKYEGFLTGQTEAIGGV